MRALIKISPWVARGVRSAPERMEGATVVEYENSDGMVLWFPVDRVVLSRISHTRRDERGTFSIPVDERM